MSGRRDPGAFPDLEGRRRIRDRPGRLNFFAVFCVPPSELRPTPIDRKFGSRREGRIEHEEEDGLRNFLRLPPALHRDYTDHLLPNLGGLVFTGKHFADDRRVDGTGCHFANYLA